MARRGDVCDEPRAFELAHAAAPRARAVAVVVAAAAPFARRRLGDRFGDGSDRLRGERERDTRER